MHEEASNSSRTSPVQFAGRLMAPQAFGNAEAITGTRHWLEVPRQRSFEPMRCAGRVWVRRGSSSVEPSPTELSELYNTFGYILTEERAIQDATASHIDLDAFDGYLRRLGFDTAEEPQPASESDLRNRSLHAVGHGRQPQHVAFLGARRFPEVPGDGGYMPAP